MNPEEVSDVYQGFETNTQDNSKIEAYLSRIEIHVQTALTELFEVIFETKLQENEL